LDWPSTQPQLYTQCLQQRKSTHAAPAHQPHKCSRPNIRRDPKMKEDKKDADTTTPRRPPPCRAHRRSTVATSPPPKQHEDTESEPQHNARGPRRIRRWTPPHSCAGATPHSPRNSCSRFVSKVAVKVVSRDALPPKPQISNRVTASCRHHLVALPMRKATATKPEDQGKSLAPSSDIVPHQRTQRC
jgi:hypothetical protein